MALWWTRGRDSVHINKIQTPKQKNNNVLLLLFITKKIAFLLSVHGDVLCCVGSVTLAIVFMSVTCLHIVLYIVHHVRLTHPCSWNSSMVWLFITQHGGRFIKSPCHRVLMSNPDGKQWLDGSYRKAAGGFTSRPKPTTSPPYVWTVFSDKTET